jgi:hypothetical protein
MSTFKQLCEEIFETISKLRESPKDFALTVKETFEYYRPDNVLHRPGTVPLQTREGVEGAVELFKELEEIDSLPPLEFSLGLTLAALQHCTDTGPLGIVGHIGSRETSLQKRVESFGKWTGNLVEALDYGSCNAFEVVLSLLVDDGLATRPHRKALLNQNFKKIGLGAGPHSEFKTVVCLLFAVGFNDNETLEAFEPSEAVVPQNPVVDEWLEGAVKLTSEIREETVQGEKVRKIKNHWEMRDGSFKIVDKVEKIEPVKVLHPVVTRKSSSSDSDKKKGSSSDSDKKKGSSSSDEGENKEHEKNPHVEHSEPVSHSEHQEAGNARTHEMHSHEENKPVHYESYHSHSSVPEPHHEVPPHPIHSVTEEVHHSIHSVTEVKHEEVHHSIHSVTEVKHEEPSHFIHLPTEVKHDEVHYSIVKHEEPPHSTHSEPEVKHEEPPHSTHSEPEVKHEDSSYSNLFAPTRYEPPSHPKVEVNIKAKSSSESEKLSKESSSSEEEDKKSSSSDF